MAFGHPFLIRTLPSYNAIMILVIAIICIYSISNSDAQLQSGLGLGGGQNMNPQMGGMGGLGLGGINPDQNAQVFTGTGNNPFYGVNLVPFGPDQGDHKVNPGFLTPGQTINLHMYFPFYGGYYNYTTVRYPVFS